MGKVEVAQVDSGIRITVEFMKATHRKDFFVVFGVGFLCAPELVAGTERTHSPVAAEKAGVGQLR